MKACLDCGQLEAARELYAEMREQGLVLALPAYNTLINAHGAASRLGMPPEDACLDPTAARMPPVHARALLRRQPLTLVVHQSSPGRWIPR